MPNLDFAEGLVIIRGEADTKMTLFSDICQIAPRKS